MSTLLGLYGGGGQAGLNRIAPAERWLHRPVAVMGDAFPRDSWANILTMGGVPAWKSTARWKAISVPLCTQNEGGGYDLTGAASGVYDAKYTALCNGLKGVPNLILRPGWEGNGSWYPWAMNAPNSTGAIVYQASRGPLFAAAFQRFVNIARSILPGVLISWNMASGQADPRPLYPGDAYVDIVSLDHYNVIWDRNYAQKIVTITNPDGSTTTQIQNAAGQLWSVTDETKRFNYLRDMNWGLTWQANFAAAHGKMLAWDEWGTGSKPSGQGYDTSCDSPAFIRLMWAWATTHNFVYATYFNYAAGDGQWQCSPDWTAMPGSITLANPTGTPCKSFPLQAAQFLTTFGAPAMSDILVDDNTAIGGDITAFRQAQTNLANAQAAVTVAQSTVTSAQAAVDAARAALLTAANKLVTDIPAA